MKCSCGGSILQKAADGSARLRIEGPVTFTADGLAKAKCFWCKKPVDVPVTLQKSAEPSPPQSPRLIVRPK